MRACRVVAAVLGSGSPQDLLLRIAAEIEAAAGDQQGGAAPLEADSAAQCATQSGLD